MGNLYDDLSSLSRLPDAYEEWTDYRAALTDFIIAATEQGSSALIVGAGESSDMNLWRLSGHFSSLSLLDRDGDAMERGLIRYGLQNSGIRCIEADIVGILPDRYRKTADRILAGLKSGRKDSELETLFRKEIEDAYSQRKPDDFPNPFAWDNVICCGVHSQLLSMHMRMAGVYARYFQIDLNRIESCLKEYNDDLIPAVNRMLIKAAEKSLIIGAETDKKGAEGRIEGAFQALSDPQLDNLQVLKKKELVWNFDRTQGKEYNMEIRAYRIKKIPD